MNWKKILRSVICLIVVCVLIVNVSPVRAHAAEAVVASMRVGASAALIAQSLGVFFENYTQPLLESIGSSFSDFIDTWGIANNKVDNVAEFLALIGTNFSSADVAKRIIVPRDIMAGVVAWVATLIKGASIDISEPVADGYAYYNNILAPYPLPGSSYRIILLKNGVYYCVSTSSKVKIASNGEYSSLWASLYKLTPSGWSFYVNGYVDGYADPDQNPILWSNYDIVKEDMYANTWVILEASDPTFTLITEQLPSAIVGTVAGSILDGSLIAENISVPSIDYSNLISSDATILEDMNSVSSQVVAGDMTHDQYLELTMPATILTLDVSHDSTQTISPGSAVQCSVFFSVAGSGTYDKSVTWSISGHKSAATTVDQTGLVTIAEDEIASLLYVTATSVAFPDVYGISTIQVARAGTVTDAVAGNLADTAAGTFIGSLIDALMTPFQWIVNQILAGIKALFVPSEDYLTSKVEALRAEFAFADSIIATADALGGAFVEFETEPPIIYMELSNAESKYDWGDRAIALDLRWYERYKPTVDVLLSAFLWAYFIWKMYNKLPGIISGMPGDFVMDSITQLGVENRLPTRTAAYDVQRAANREYIRKGPGK